MWLVDVVGRPACSWAGLFLAAGAWRGWRGLAWSQAEPGAAGVGPLGPRRGAWGVTFVTWNGDVCY